MTYDNISRSLTDMFSHGFKTAYGALRGRNKSRLLRHTSSFFRRWYYSAIVENTVITPANIFGALSERAAAAQYKYVNLRPRSFLKLTEPVIEPLLYSRNRHPVIDDIRVFLDSCEPDFELTETGGLTEKHADYLMARVSICDPFYIEYLTLLCLSMGLVRRAPSVHSSVARVSRDARERLDMDGEQLLGRVIDVSCGIAADFINSLFPGDRYMHKDYILNMLKDPIATDDIYKNIYAWLGMDIDDFTDAFNGKDTEEFCGALISNTFYLGVMLDKYFHTVFGYYLRLICPWYIIPYDFKKDLAYAAELLGEDDIGSALFTPCSHYTITKLGLDFFGLRQGEEIQAHKEMAVNFLTKYLSCNNWTLADFKRVIDEQAGLSALRAASPAVYELKVRLRGRKEFWKNIEVTCTSNVHELCLDIGFEFFAMLVADYSLYSGPEESPFLEYAPRGENERGKRSDECQLKDLGAEPGGRMLLVFRGVYSPYEAKPGADNPADITPVLKKSLALEITVVKEKPFDRGAFYPSVTRQSAAIRRIDEFLRGE